MVTTSFKAPVLTLDNYAALWFKDIVYYSFAAFLSAHNFFEILDLRLALLLTSLLSVTFSAKVALNHAHLRLGTRVCVMMLIQ